MRIIQYEFFFVSLLSMNAIILSFIQSIYHIPFLAIKIYDPIHVPLVVARSTPNDKQDLGGTNKHRVFPTITNGACSSPAQKSELTLSSNYAREAGETARPVAGRETRRRGRGRGQAGQLSVHAPETQTGSQEPEPQKPSRVMSLRRRLRGN